ncbi:unnamed protein product [Alopecurus aequalis]
MDAFSTRIHGFLVLSCVSYLASHAAAFSFNHGGSDYSGLISPHGTSFATNTAEPLGIFSGPGVSIRRGSTITRRITNTSDHHVDASIEDLLREKREFPNYSTWLFSTVFSFSTGYVGDSESQVYENILGRAGLGFNLPYTKLVPRNWAPDEPARTRKLLSRGYGQSTTTQHAAIRWKVPSSLLKQVSIPASALVGLICAVAGLVRCCIRSKRPRQSTAAIKLQDHEHIMLPRGSGPREFTHSELAAATDNFSEERKIGRGGFGPVYRGYLSKEGRHVAIKVLSQEQSVQGLKEFQAEVTILSQLRHRNVVRLVGWCGRWRGLALVYELLPGGSLDTHLYHPDTHLTWPQRYKIALGLGSALRYLHAECDQCVVHGDIKPANVMLDASLDTKLGDFGLAKLVDHGVEPLTTRVIAGTIGYIDPEFVSSRRPSAESDVYSFGVVLLEIACGRRPRPRPSGQDASAPAALLASVRDMYRRNVILEAADPRLGGEFDGVQLERLFVTGLWCAHHDPVQRPSVEQAVDVLRSQDAELPVLGTMGGSGEIRALEGRAYNDLCAETSAHESTETAYLTTEETAYL